MLVVAMRHNLSNRVETQPQSMRSAQCGLQTKLHSKHALIGMMSRILCLCSFRIESFTSFSADDLVLTDISKSVLSAYA